MGACGSHEDCVPTVKKVQPIADKTRTSLEDVLELDRMRRVSKYSSRREQAQRAKLQKQIVATEESAN